jgi:hypothetical protein
MTWTFPPLTKIISAIHQSLARRVLMSRGGWIEKIRSPAQNVVMNLHDKPELKLDWCSHEAARFACQRWHYSKSMPSSKTVKIGVWENKKFIGAIVFAWGANLRLAGEFGLAMTEVAELCRVALAIHQTPVSRVVSIGIKMLKLLCPGIRLLVSYADPEHGHVGGIYQAMGWTYVGERSGTSVVLLYGKPRHRRTVNSLFGTSSIEWLRAHIDTNAAKVPSLKKHKYLLGLDIEMKTQIAPLAMSYPKKCAPGAENDTSTTQVEKAGEIPSGALQFSGCTH